MKRISYVSHFQLFHFEEIIFPTFSACMQNAVDKAHTQLIRRFFDRMEAKDKNYVHIIASGIVLLS